MSEKTFPEPDGDAPAEKPRNKGGRPRGSRSKIGGRVPNPSWLRDMISQCYPREEYERRFKSLTPYEQFQIASRLAPKDLRVDAHSTARLQVVGLLVGNEYRRELLELKSKQALPPSPTAPDDDADGGSEEGE